MVSDRDATGIIRQSLHWSRGGHANTGGYVHRKRYRAGCSKPKPERQFQPRCRYDTVAYNERRWNYAGGDAARYGGSIVPQVLECCGRQPSWLHLEHLARNSAIWPQPTTRTGMPDELRNANLREPHAGRHVQFFTVQVRDSLGNTAQQSFSLIINSGTPPTITSTTLTPGAIGQAYSFAFTASGGTGNYTWSFIGSSPDPGLQLSSTGVLQGTSGVANDCPTGPGIWIGNQPPFGTFSSSSFQVKVTDAAGQSANKQFCLPAYYPTPQVTSVTPSSIPSDGQTHSLTITGSNFRNTAEVYIQGKGFVSAAFVNSTTLTFSITSNAGNGWGTGTYTLWIVQPYANVSNMDRNFGIQ